jgi:hypothetical protein
MIESKTIKINLKEVIQDFTFAYADRDNELVKELQNDFEEVYLKQSDKIQSDMIRYLTNHSCVKDDTKILMYFSSFLK